MTKAIAHRGPDDQGFFNDDSVYFGFVRLSIIDLSKSGHQPFISEDERYVMVFNGEIFNYIELREELTSLGHEFRTNTDTEVLLNSFIEWGENCQHKFNGMWSFAIYDKQLNTVFISRDRYGIKPFYYTFIDGDFYFSSEINGILNVDGFDRKPNNKIIFDYLVFNRMEHTNETFFENIYKLPHGHSITFNLNEPKLNLKIKKWYDLRESVFKAEDLENSEEFKNLFFDAVKLRLRSDVPIGVCLSGGLDSSALTSVIIKELNVNNLNTFSAVYGKGYSADESHYINLYSDEPGNRFFTTPTADSLMSNLNKFVLAHAEPIPSTSPYAQFKVMELAQEKVKVTLDGQGADELLGGYHYMFAFYFKELLLNFRWIKLGKEVNFYFKNHRNFQPLSYLFFSLLPNKLKVIFGTKIAKDLDESFIKENQYKSTIAENLYNSKTFKDHLLDHFEYKLEHLLKWEDRNSMIHSIEARVPFLDHRLVERTLASDKLLHPENGTTKVLLRSAMSGIIPDKIRDRGDKIGFGTPQDEWFRTDVWNKFILELINSDSFKSRGIFNVSRVNKIYQEHYNKKRNVANTIWKWIHLELWFREFIDN